MNIKILFTIILFSILLNLPSCHCRATGINIESQKIAEKETENVADGATKKEIEKVDDKITENEPEKVDDKITEKESEKVDDKITEKESEIVDDKITENKPEKVDDKITENESEKVDDKIIEKESEKVDDKITEKESEKVDDKITEKKQEKVDDKITENEPEKVDKIPEKKPNKFDDKITEKEPEKVGDKITVKEPEKIADKNTENEDDKVNEDVNKKEKFAEKETDKLADKAAENEGNKIGEIVTENESEKVNDKVIEKEPEKLVDNVKNIETEKTIDKESEKETEKLVDKITESEENKVPDKATKQEIGKSADKETEKEKVNPTDKLNEKIEGSSDKVIKKEKEKSLDNVNKEEPEKVTKRETKTLDDKLTEEETKKSSDKTNLKETEKLEKGVEKEVEKIGEKEAEKTAAKEVETVSEKEVEKTVKEKVDKVVEKKIHEKVSEKETEKIDEKVEEKDASALSDKISETDTEKVTDKTTVKEIKKVDDIIPEKEPEKISKIKTEKITEKGEKSESKTTEKEITEVVVKEPEKAIEEGILPDEGRSFKPIFERQFHDCVCISRLQCNNGGDGTVSKKNECTNKDEICCLEEEITVSAIRNILANVEKTIKEIFVLKDTPVIKDTPVSRDTSVTRDTSVINDTFDNCTCFTEDDCLEIQGTVSTFGSNSPTCPNSSFICCILSITEEDLFTGILGEEIPPETSAETSNCKCVPEETCDQSLSTQVNLRSSVSSSNNCENPNEVCCEGKNIISSVSTSETVRNCSCTVIELCSEKFESATFDTGFGTNECNSALEVCCSSDKILERSTSVFESKHQTDCTCVHSSKCKTSSKNLAFLVDLRSQECNDLSLVCCFPEDISAETTKDELNCTCMHETLCNDTEIAPEHINTQARCINTEICCSQPKLFEHSLSCGQSHESNARINIRIGLGTQSRFAEFPWMVAIFEVEPSGKETFKCGGALVHPKIVLTTAHCIDDSKGIQLKARAGDWDLSSTSEKHPFVERFVTSRIIHPDFSRRTLRFNTGLLYLESDIPLQYHINTVCLPRSEEYHEYLNLCVATGWGKTNFGTGGLFQSSLKKLEIPLVNREECQTRLRNTKLGPKFSLDSSFTCAGGARGDTCTGDGGSPLVCLMTDGSNRYLHVGAVAWGIECGKENIPGVYASTFSVTNWIREIVTKDFGIDDLKYFT